MLHTSGCFIRQELSPWTFKIALVSPLPPLMLSLIAVYMGMEGNERNDVWEHNEGMSCVYRRGHIMQLVLGADKAKGGGIIRCSASSEELFKAAKASIKRVMQSFFPGELPASFAYAHAHKHRYKHRSHIRNHSLSSIALS
jgi:hypothetical protein